MIALGCEANRQLRQAGRFFGRRSQRRCAAIAVPRRVYQLEHCEDEGVLRLDNWGALHHAGVLDVGLVQSQVQWRLNSAVQPQFCDPVGVANGLRMLLELHPSMWLKRALWSSSQWLSEVSTWQMLISAPAAVRS